jgi:hypothetical protein
LSFPFLIRYVTHSTKTGCPEWNGDSHTQVFLIIRSGVIRRTPCSSALSDYDLAIDRIQAATILRGALPMFFAAIPSAGHNSAANTVSGYPRHPVVF